MDTIKIEKFKTAIQCLKDCCILNEREETESMKEMIKDFEEELIKMYEEALNEKK